MVIYSVSLAFSLMASTVSTVLASSSEISTGRELGFELLDDFGVHLLVDLHLEHEHQQAEHDQVERT